MPQFSRWHTVAVSVFENSQKKSTFLWKWRVFSIRFNYLLFWSCCKQMSVRNYVRLNARTRVCWAKTKKVGVHIIMWHTVGPYRLTTRPLWSTRNLVQFNLWHRTKWPFAPPLRTRKEEKRSSRHVPLFTKFWKIDRRDERGTQTPLRTKSISVWVEKNGCECGGGSVHCARAID